MKTLKEATGRTKSAIMRMSRIMDRVEKRSSKKINKELEDEVKTLRKALTDASNTMMLMRTEIDKPKEELKRYKKGKDGIRKKVKNIGTSPIVKNRKNSRKDELYLNEETIYSKIDEIFDKRLKERGFN